MNTDTVSHVIGLNSSYSALYGSYNILMDNNFQMMEINHITIF
jgi:hypothetical protein